MTEPTSDEPAKNEPARDPEPVRPHVDVVIATRGNRPELLRTALEGVRTQTYAGTITTTVVFDQSEPDTTLVVEEPHRRVQVVRNTRSPGLAGGRNSGVAAGHGEFIGFCDDDDAWLPTKVEKQVAALEADPRALTSVTGVVVQYSDHSVPRVPDPADMNLDTLVRNRVFEAHPSTVMVRREAFLGPIGEVDEEIPGSFGEDYDWIIRAAKAGGFAVVPEPLVTVLWGQSLFSRNWPTIIAALQYLVDKHPEFAANPHAHARILGQQAFAWAAQGDRARALGLVRRTVRLNPKERRAYVAGVVALHLVSAERVMTMAHRRGKGI